MIFNQEYQVDNYFDAEKKPLMEIESDDEQQHSFVNRFLFGGSDKPLMNAFKFGQDDSELSSRESINHDKNESKI